MGMTNRIARRAAVVATIGLSLLMACNGGAKDQPAAGAAAAKPDSGKITIAVIGKSSSNPVFLAARTGAEQAAKDISAKQHLNVTVNWLTPPQEDAEMQAQRIRQAVNDGADGILLSASDAGKVTGAINDAVDRGVPVMMFDSDAPQSKRFAIYGVDDEKSGEAVMKELAAALGDKGKVAILAGNQNAPNLQRRVQGVKAEAAKHPGIEIVGVFNHIETPQDAAAEVIRVNNAYPQVTGWAMVGGWPLFTQTLLTDLDPKKQKVVSIDALAAELPYVEKGITPVLLAQPVYKWGYVGVETLVDKIHNKKDPASPVIPMDLVRVTKDNLGSWARQLKDWGFTDVPQKYLDMK
jgi:ribose transport system substrate-binding protein